jgi:MFS family permease
MPRSSGRVFYGYYLAAFAFSVGFISGCVYLYSRGVFVRDQIVDFEASRTEISLVFTAVQIVSTWFAPVLGYLLDKYPIRRVMMAGAVALVIGFVAMSQAQTLIQFTVVTAVFLGFGVGCVGTTANTKLMVNWFNRRRGLALGIAIMGYSAAGTVMSPIALFLLNNIGWRGSYLLFAGICLFVVLPAIALLVKQRPQDIGVGPDGDPWQPPPTAAGDLEAHLTARPEAAAPGHGGWQRYWQAFTAQLAVYVSFARSLPFWGVVFTFGLMAGTFGGFNVHLFLYYTELGIDEYRATLILSFTSGLAIVSKPMFGWLIDNVNPRTATLVSCACYTIAMLCFSFFSSFALLFLAGAIFGLGFGGMVPVRAAILSRLFSTDEYARAYGSLRLCMFPLTVLWTPLIGYIYDTSGSYQPAFELFAVLFTVAAGIAWLLIPARIVESSAPTAVVGGSRSTDVRSA